ADPFGPALDRAVAGETINRSPLAAKRIARVQDAAGCRILFIAASEGKQLRSILAQLSNAPVLTVSDDPLFTRRGGMIQFVFEDNRVRFEVNLAAVQRARLTLSSELVKLASAVRRAP
ncbi:MAG TPA: YfiR family protein, partial [Bryobacteraceae bacterium]|nr:YfiR family protein [Bryobacteraceae bacterium]